MTMVINILIDKISMEHVKSIRKMKILWNWSWTIHQQKVCSTCYTIQVNDWECTTASITLILWLYHPQPSVFIRFLARNQPVDQCAGIVSVIECEWKEEKCTCNCHAWHSIKLGTGLNKHHIASSILAMPVWIWANAFPVHPTCSTKVTGSIEMCNCRMVDFNSSTKVRAVIDVNISRWNIIKLFIEEASKEIWELQLINVHCKIFNSAWVPLF